MRPTYAAIVLAAVISIPTIGPAASLPSFSSSAYCKKVADTAGGSYQIEEGCMQIESDSVRALQSMDIPDRVMRYCTEVAETSGGSYQILHGCVQIELEAKGRLNQ